MENEYRAAPALFTKLSCEAPALRGGTEEGTLKYHEGTDHMDPGVQVWQAVQH